MRGLRFSSGRPAMSESQALSHLRGVFDQLPVAVCLLRGPEHVFEFTSPGYRALIGGRAVEGLTVEAALPEARAQGLVDILDSVYETGEQHVGREVDAVLLRDDGIEG